MGVSSPAGNARSGSVAGGGVSPGLMGAGVVLGLSAVVAWWWPAVKRNAVFGRYDYAEFWVAVGLTCGALSVLAVGAVPSRWRRAVGFRVVALWLGLLAGLALVETAARFLPVKNQMDNPWYFAAGGGLAKSDELPFGRPAHLHWEGLSRGDLAQLNNDPDPFARWITFQTDWEGFHNQSDIRQADLVTVGDSFTEAGNVPVEENFTSRIGRKLGMTSRNLGRAGYSPPIELMVLKQYALRCRPKIVVWQIAASNDLDDSRRYEEWVAAGRPPFFDAQTDRRWLRAKAWERRSPTHWVFDRLRHHDPHPWPYDGKFRDHAGVEQPVRFFNLPVLNYPAREHPGWPEFARAVTAGAALCRSNDIRLVLVLVPVKYQVLGPYTRMLDPEMPPLDASNAVPAADSLSGALGGLCSSLGVDFVDATAALQSRAKAGELVYLPYDTHLSPLGHEVVADVVVARLMADGAAPPAVKP